GSSESCNSKEHWGRVLGYRAESTRNVRLQDKAVYNTILVIYWHPVTLREPGVHLWVPLVEGQCSVLAGAFQRERKYRESTGKQDGSGESQHSDLRSKRRKAGSVQQRCTHPIERMRERDHLAEQAQRLGQRGNGEKG